MVQSMVAAHEGVVMHERLSDLELQVAQLESRLATARSDLERIRVQARKTPGIVSLVVPLIAVSTLLIAAAPIPNVVTAPFRVMDSSGKKKIFEVHEDGAPDEHHQVRRGFSVYDSAETEVLAGVAEEGHSYLEAGATIEADIRMGVIPAGPVFTMRTGGHDRISMAVTNGEPMLNMTNDNNTVMMAIGQNENLGGVLLLTDAKGVPMVKFSTSANGAGTVVTYPNGSAGGAVVGLKGSMLCGRGGCGQ
jgi:hypothetical protein